MRHRSKLRTGLAALAMALAPISAQAQEKPDSIVPGQLIELSDSILVDGGQSSRKDFSNDFSTLDAKLLVEEIEVSTVVPGGYFLSPYQDFFSGTVIYVNNIPLRTHRSLGFNLAFPYSIAHSDFRITNPTALHPNEDMGIVFTRRTEPGFRIESSPFQNGAIAGMTGSGWEIGGDLDYTAQFPFLWPPSLKQKTAVFPSGPRAKIFGSVGDEGCRLSTEASGYQYTTGYHNLHNLIRYREVANYLLTFLQGSCPLYEDFRFQVTTNVQAGSTNTLTIDDINEGEIEETKINEDLYSRTIEAAISHGSGIFGVRQIQDNMTHFSGQQENPAEVQIFADQTVYFDSGTSLRANSRVGITNSSANLSAHAKISQQLGGLILAVEAGRIYDAFTSRRLSSSIALTNEVAPTDNRYIEISKTIRNRNHSVKYGIEFIDTNLSAYDLDVSGQNLFVSYDFLRDNILFYISGRFRSISSDVENTEIPGFSPGDLKALLGYQNERFSLGFVSIHRHNVNSYEGQPLGNQEYFNPYVRLSLGSFKFAAEIGNLLGPIRDVNIASNGGELIPDPGLVPHITGSIDGDFFSYLIDKLPFIELN